MLQEAGDRMNEMEKVFYNLEKCFINNMNQLLNSNQAWKNLLNVQSLTNEKVYEKDNKVYVQLELPHLSKDHQLHLSVDRDHLIVQGQLTKQKKVKSDKGYHRSEDYAEYFYKAIPLNVNVTSKEAKAVYDKGVLKVTLHKIGELDDGNIQIDYKRY